MTWEQLGQQIHMMSDDQKQSNVTIYLVDQDEYFGIFSDDALETTKGDDVLSNGELYLELKTTK